MSENAAEINGFYQSPFHVLMSSPVYVFIELFIIMLVARLVRYDFCNLPWV